MSTWIEFCEAVGLPMGKPRWGLLLTVLVLLAAGWLLQERVTALRLNDLDYSDLCQLVDEGKVRVLEIKGQTIEGDFFEAQKIAGHRTMVFRTTAPTNDPSFWPLLREKKVHVRVIATGPGLLTRWVIGSVPLALYVAFGLWGSRRKPDEVSR